MGLLVSSALYLESQAIIWIKVPLLPSKQKESFFPPKIPSGKKILQTSYVQKHNKKKKNSKISQDQKVVLAGTL